MKILGHFFYLKVLIQYKILIKLIKILFFNNKQKILIVFILIVFKNNLLKLKLFYFNKQNFLLEK